MNESSGVEYKSVTSLINSYKEKFDVEKFSKIIAEREGKTQQEIKDRWNDIRNEACNYGTSNHDKIEKFYTSKGEDFKDDEIVQNFHKFSEFNFNKIKNEVLVYNHEYRIAGTSDFIIENGKNFDVCDLKTNKNFNLISKYNKKLFAPLSHLPECEYSIYALQVSTYAYLYETMTGKNVGSLSIIWFNKNNNNFERFFTPYLYSDVKNMLNDYRSKWITIK